MDLIRDSLWPICGFYMGLLWYIDFHMKHTSLLVLTFHCLYYGKDTYLVKIHTIPIYGINMRYGNGMGAEMKPIYGKIWDMVIVWELHITPSSMGKLRIS